MRKILFLVIPVLLLASACINRNVSETSSSQPQINQHPVQNTNNQRITSSANKAATVKNNENGYDGNSYEYNGTTLTYGPYPGDRGYVTVFINENGVRRKLIDKAIKDIPGDSYPQFRKTADPNIALFDAETGDAGGYVQEYYFIVLSTKQILKIVNTNGPLIKVTDFRGNVSKLELAISNACAVEETKNNLTAVLKGINLDNKISFTLPQRQTLTCLHPGGLGPLSNPEFNLIPKGVSADLSRVYFTLRESKIKDGNYTSSIDDNYSFILSTKQINREEPQNLLYLIKQQ